LELETGETERSLQGERKRDARKRGRAPTMVYLSPHPGARAVFLPDTVCLHPKLDAEAPPLTVHRDVWWHWEAIIVCDSQA
jgi:hypothetical protein